MSCDKSAQVHAYHDDALATSGRVALEAHLESCADCQALLADLRGLSNLIAAAPLVTMSPEAMNRLAKSWRTARDRGLLRITSWLTAAAAAVLVGALLFVSDRNGTINPTLLTSSEPAWETVAVMPPLEADENVPEIVALATWMANDLSLGERQ
jgi:anti-sigma factor RsiW